MKIHNKILFIAPDYYGFNDVVFEGLKTYSGATVFQIISNENYKYKNITEKIHNFLSKVFLKKNLKKEKSSAQILNKIQNIIDIDLTIINRPDLLSEKQLDCVFQNSKKVNALLWDSLEKIPISETILKRFHLVQSFDEKDCRRHHFQKITNFYFQKKVDSINVCDIAFIGTYDERISTLLKIFSYFKENNFKAKAKIFSHHPKKIDQNFRENIENINEIIPFNKSFSFYEDSFAILDLAQPNQEGLSFRPFEAIGLEKKLVTTNKNIINYDFYDSENIYIIDDIDSINLPESFLNSPFKKLPAAISDKYFIQNWIQNITNQL